MQEIDKIIQNYLLELAYEPILTMLSKTNTGKKLRSKLLLSIAGESQKAYVLCAIIELIHLASLLHDDIIDESELRRGARSINAEFGAKNALMLGDILYSKAFYELSKQEAKISQILSNAVCKLAIGELMDVNLSKKFNPDKEAYLTMIYHKTAVLIEASARCGALLAKLNENAFAEYGKNLGLAFQIVDDILDITGDEATLGKPALSDFKEGKTTLAYIYLYESLNENDKKILKNLFKKDLNKEERLWLKQKFKEKNIIEQSIKKAKEYGNLSLKAIENDKNEKLEAIIKTLIDRDF
ncbi:octaprenyl-diphosphate synthase (ispB) [Campylobacter upsaliensis RM3195]|uniref:polyprenyl synthetase family protein n=1 Tax=Campylobacter upsaliensis TaxID=28080 RepID=UPI00004B33C2|nr:polyprenyl synthetase family protein [Campylobacter upsaliensis]EAL54104.1 octaprenyl-diphosphate synthase (ispB) [Campylobacter upsaliensis RM3195]MCR2102920.1 polyprenyl synthetase family protein [Campylobacter upsaliensis]MCR2109767.1 polyprenyl synthetase family protein [Campylobacter upsaliensis]MCR2113870.1 polyprenyl synthetase family protein [Campylobacter upsaliensis]MCR2114998.1 polyprenyl synthetase family protein [Campylobacter upsaliensis]